MKKHKIILLVSIFLIFIGLFQIIFYNDNPGGKYLNLPDGKLAYDEYGSGQRNVVLIHGSPGTKEDFKLLGPELANKGFKVYSFDMYGFGESEKNVKNYGIESASETLNLAFEEIGIEKASILGYSWGGGVVSVFASEFPEKTEKIILFSAMGLQEGEPLGSYFLEHLRYSIAYPFVVWYPGAFAGGQGWRKGFMRSFMDSDQRIVREKLEKISMNKGIDSLVLHGNKDMVVQSWVAEEHARLLDASIVFYDGDHMTVFSDVEEIAKHLEEFLNER